MGRLGRAGSRSRPAAARWRSEADDRRSDSASPGTGVRIGVGRDDTVGDECARCLDAPASALVRNSAGERACRRAPASALRRASSRTKSSGCTRSRADHGSRRDRAACRRGARQPRRAPRSPHQIPSARPRQLFLIAKCRIVVRETDQPAPLETTGGVLRVTRSPGIRRLWPRRRVQPASPKRCASSASPALTRD